MDIKYEYIAESNTFRRFFNLMHDLMGINVELKSPDFKKQKKLYLESDTTKLCQIINTSKNGFCDCMKSDKYHCQKAFELKKGYYYICHAGLYDMVIPIIINNNHIATMICGQLLPSPPSNEGFKKFLPLANRYNIPIEKLKEAYFQSPFIDEGKLIALLDLLCFFSDYFCEIGVKLKYDQDRLLQNEIYNAKLYIDKNFENSIKLVDVANHVNLSQAYLSKLFKEEMNISFTEYLNQLRIDKAINLLKNTNEQIKKIAKSVGYNNFIHFNRMFNRIVKCSPRKYRKKVKENTVLNKKGD